MFQQLKFIILLWLVICPDGIAELTPEEIMEKHNLVYDELGIYM